MRPHQASEIGQMRQVVLAPQEQTAELLLELGTARVKAGCETLQFSAARVKFKVSQSAGK